MATIAKCGNQPFQPTTQRFLHRLRPGESVEKQGVPLVSHSAFRLSVKAQPERFCSFRLWSAKHVDDSGRGQRAPGGFALSFHYRCILKIIRISPPKVSRQEVWLLDVFLQRIKAESSP